MSLTEEKFEILDEVAGRLLVADIVDNSLLLSDAKIQRNEIHVLSDKTFDRNIIKKSITVNKAYTESLPSYSFNCAICQNVCKNCKNICVTCKSPCFVCLPKSCKPSYTDTDDFDKYLESLSKKIKIPPKIKAVGTDTCDLESHFDYYKLEKKTIRIQKHVATDCLDLILRRPVSKKSLKNSIGVDTSDLITFEKVSDKEDSDCEFFWNETEDTKTYSKKQTEKPKKVDQKPCEDDTSVNSLVIDEDSSLHPNFKESEDKENLNINVSEDVNFFNDSGGSDESDIDLATSCKVSKCKELAKKHQIKLKVINNKTEILYKCSICEESFGKKYLGLLHLGTHIEGELFKCLTCESLFQTVNSLQSHVKKSHLRKESVIVKNETENKENSEVDNVKQKTKVFKCNICVSENGTTVSFCSSKELHMHKKEQHGIEKPNESEIESKPEKKPRIKREFICLLCGKQFKSSKALKDHSPVHTGEKNYHCDICNKSYTTSANLKIHKKTHTGARDFVCSVCGKAFHKKDSLKVHFRKHSGERPFQCDLCPMKFDRNYILKNHRYTHFSEKTFICPVCGKTFTTHGGLNNHEKSHKKDPFTKKPRKPAVKPTLDTENAVICDVCGKIYSTKNNLRIHKFVHLGVKPFKCTICQQTYAKKDSMLIHMRKHTDERPFACETCGMTFYRNHTLKTHLLRHTGERPHKCKMCGKSFTQSSSLTYHIRNHDKKSDKKKQATDDSTKTKKKRINSGNVKTSSNKKLLKTVKTESDIDSFDVKTIYDKKTIEGTSKEAMVLNLPEKLPGDILKGSHFMLQVPEKEILILDKGLGVELSRNYKEIDYFGLDKETSYSSQYNLGKFNYYIAKSHVFPLPKESIKPLKTEPRDVEISVGKTEEDVGNLIISKNSYITKEGNLITVNRDSSGKEIVQIEDQRVDIKQQTTIPITGEILNAAFISDENGDVVPLGSMAFGLSTDNVMISPYISVDGEERKGVIRNSKVAVVDTKSTCSAGGNRLLGEKNTGKGNGHVINLREPRVSQKIQIELDPHALHIQTPVIDDSTIHGMSGFYSNVQQNEI